MEQVYFHHDNLVTNRVREISFPDWFLISKNIRKYISIKMRSRARYHTPKSDFNGVGSVKKSEVFFLLYNNNLLLHMLGSEQRYTTFRLFSLPIDS